MSGTREGGAKTRQTIIERYGENYWREKGKMGGAGTHKPGSLAGFQNMPREERIAAGRIGGKISKRGPSKKGTMGSTWATTKRSSASSSSTLKTSRKGTCLECGDHRVTYKDSGFCQQCYKRLGKRGRALVDEAQAINRGEKANNYETVTVPGWGHLDDRPEFIIEQQPSVLTRLFGRRHRR